jgi:hypothetical protein
VGAVAREGLLLSPRSLEEIQDKFVSNLIKKTHRKNFPWVCIVEFKLKLLDE